MKDNITPATEYLTQQAINLFEDETVALLWLTSPKDLLKGKSPLEVANESDKGFDQIYDILVRIEYGIFA